MLDDLHAFSCDSSNVSRVSIAPAEQVKKLCNELGGSVVLVEQVNQMGDSKHSLSWPKFLTKLGLTSPESTGLKFPLIN